MATTTNLGITKPTVGASLDTWGTEINAGTDAIDAVFKADGTGTSVGLNVGAGKTASVAGTLNVTGTLSGGVIAPLASPTFTGTPAAPTASYGTSTTQLATTMFVQQALAAVYPVGSIYITTSSADPNGTFGFGSWVAFGAGKVLVGQDTSDASFDVLEETGGSKDAIVVSHTHAVTDPGHTHDVNIGKFNNYSADNYTSGRNTLEDGNYPSGTKTYTTTSNTTGIGIDSAGSSGTNANLQPYVVVKMWKRVS